MENIFDISKKVILFSGGYGYLGSPCVKYMAEQGANVIVLARNEEKFNKEFQAYKNVYFEFCDVSKSLSIKKAFEKSFNNFGRLDAVINNAFYSKGQSPEFMSDEDFEFGIEGTLNSVFKCIREIIPYFKNQGFGKIVNVSSMYGVVAPDFSLYADSPNSLNPPHYGAAKAGIIQLSKYYASYLGKLNIQVNSVTPGPFPSEIVQINDPEFIKRLANNTLLGRIGNPIELVGAIMLLVSKASDFITGQNIIVDGGWTSK